MIIIKYVNATLHCYDNSISQTAFGGEFPTFLTSVKCRYNKRIKQYKSNKFGIMLFLNIRGSIQNKEDNPIVQKKRLKFQIRLTRVSDNTDEQIHYNLSDFIIDLADESILSHGQFKYLDLINIIDVSGLTVPTLGHYIIKVLVKEENEELYDIQSVSSVYFVER